MVSTSQKAYQRAIDRIKREYPETYYVPGFGWCGPGWQQMKARAEAASELRWRAVSKGY